MKAWQGWIPLILLAAATGLAVLISLISNAARDWLLRWLWDPIAQDLGYNELNTTVLLALAVAGVTWLALQFRFYGEEVDFRAAVGGLVIYAWAVSLRVLEDADLFAPFSAELRANGGMTGDACLPDPSHFSDCAGVLFVTPLLWIWIALIMFVLARIGLHVQRRGDVAGQVAAQKRARLVLLALWSPTAILWLLSPTWMAVVPNPILPALAAIIAGVIFMRLPRLHWTHFLTAGSAIYLASTAGLLFTWMTGGSGTWSPTNETRPYLLFWIPAAIAVLLLLRWITARNLAHQPPSRKSGSKSLAPFVQLYLDTAAAVLLFAGLVGVVLWHEGLGSAWGMLPFVGVVILPTASRAFGQRYGDPRIMEYRSNVALLVLGGQVADATVTAIGLDVFGAGEKHLVPRLLINLLEKLNLPSPLGDYPAAIILLTYKLALVAIATWILGVRGVAWPGNPSLRRLAYLVVGFVGFGPALRNLIRMAMGV